MKHVSLVLRFWVNLLKNPDFVFDIHKSVTVDSCLSVISQAYIDACSTSETKYTKDTPSAKLLYVNEVKQYKDHVRGYVPLAKCLMCCIVCPCVFVCVCVYMCVGTCIQLNRRPVHATTTKSGSVV